MWDRGNDGVDVLAGWDEGRSSDVVGGVVGWGGWGGVVV